MPWRINFTHKAEEDLEKLDKKLKERILNKIIWMRDNFDQMNLLPLSNEWQGFYKLRAGDWRIIYNISGESKEIFIYKIENRDKVYKRK
jgi:mRNA interferase RelE/StbE